MSITAFIFARRVKRIPNKNIKNFAGKPLIAWTIEKCLSVKEIKRVIVSTDSKKIAQISKFYGADVPFFRPKSLCTDNASEFMAWKHALNFLKNEENQLPKYFLSVPTTSPLRSSADIKKCISKIKNSKNDIVISVSKTNKNPFFNMIQIDKRQKAKLIIRKRNKFNNLQQSPKIYTITTVAYAAKSKFIMNNSHIFQSANIGVVEIPIERSIDIDSLYDFKIAEYLKIGKIKLKNI